MLQKPVLQTGIYPPYGKNTKTAAPEVLATGKVGIKMQQGFIL
jgi:hypothetical protein